MPQLVNNEGIPLVLNLIKEYYKNAESIIPEYIQEREFGFGNFDVKIAYRHFAFRDKEELKKYLISNPPPYISCSSALYRYPAARPMEAKGWKGSELVFDLDVTDMNIPCQLVHGKSWICEICLSNVKDETIKLIEDFLIPDFGFSDNEISVNFSGNRGYHVHINSKEVLKLDAYARKEISDYISGSGIEYSQFFFEKKLDEGSSGRKRVVIFGPKPDDKGWSGKIARNFLSKLNDSSEVLVNLGIDKKTAVNLYRKRIIVEMGIKKGNWDYVYIKDKKDFWSKITRVQAIMQSDKIDRNVTNDPSHLLRLPNSIHGETGLIAKRLRSYKELKDFDPMKDAIAFKKKELRINADTRYGVVLNGERYGPYKNVDVTVPLYVALYLYLKGFAKILF